MTDTQYENGRTLVFRVGALERKVEKINPELLEVQIDDLRNEMRQMKWAFVGFAFSAIIAAITIAFIVVSGA